MLLLPRWRNRPVEGGASLCARSMIGTNPSGSLLFVMDSSTNPAIPSGASE